MQPTRLLPLIADRQAFSAVFTNDAAWEPAIAFLIRKHALDGDVSRGALGSHIVYRVGDRWIKLMAPIFFREMAYERSGLRAVAGRLSVRTPELLAEGEIEGWPYAILSHVEGEAIRFAWPRLSSKAKSEVAEQIGRIAREIHACPFDEAIANRFSWNEFIRAQIESIEAQQVRKGLPDAWLAEVRGFCGRFDVAEFECAAPALIHADLTHDHFLISENRARGVIDFADCYFSLVTYFKAEMESCAPGDFGALARLVFPIS